MLTNAPFADIVAPQVDDGWGMISSTEEGYDFTDSSGGEVSLVEGYTGAHYIVLAFSDNYDASDSKYSISATWNGGESIENSWTTIEAEDDSALDSVREHKDIDHPVAIEIQSGLSAGEYEIKVKVTEDGDPWKILEPSQ